MLISRSLPRLQAALLLLLGTVCGFHPAAAAQDVELLGEIHGTRPPDSYFRELQRDPEAFRFDREGPGRLRALRDGMRATSAGAATPGQAPARHIGPREDPVVGMFPIPLVLGTFLGGSPPYTNEQVQTEFFSGPNSYAMTLPEFYTEMSRGLVELVGTTFDWIDTGLTQPQVTLGESGLVGSQTGGVGAFIEAVLSALDDGSIDWSQFDQSGDGYVDVLTVLHPTSGAECDGASDRVWSHRWTLRSATSGRLVDGFETSTPNPNGPGNIRINDYTIQPLLACDEEAISEIGTFAHEMGHAFGLPDLYRTGGASFYAGAGNWDLMGTGGFGCTGGVPQHPCHLGAWTKSMLGWLTVEDVAPDTDEVLTLDPVETGGRVLRLPARDGANEYILLENRQRIGTDAFLPEPGLFVWHIDDDLLAAAWPANGVNNNPSHPAVWLRQADGRNDLFSTVGGRGDRGDPFPGCIKPSPFDYGNPAIPCGENTAFHAGTTPAALSHLGGGLGTTVTEIELLGAPPHDVRFRVNTQLLTIRVEAEQVGIPANVPGFELDGALQGGTPIAFGSAPFQTHEIVAAGGIPLSPGARVSFLEWADGAPRSRSFTTGFEDATLLARYQDPEIRLRVNTNEPVLGVVPGTFSADPGGKTPEGTDFWYPSGTVVSVLATPRTGFSFTDWVGVVPPTANPGVVTLDAPTEVQANFDVIYALVALPSSVAIEAAAPQQIILEVTEANDPVTWTLVSGALPPGLFLGAETGIIGGAATQTGAFEVGVLATDAIGLEARARLEIDVGPPSLGVAGLVSSFVGAEDELTVLQKQFFDLVGNSNGSYDIGDFRAYLLANPELPEAPVGRTVSRTPVPVTVRLSPSSSSGRTPSADGGRR